MGNSSLAGLDYWLRWEVPVCALIILLPSIGAVLLVRRVKGAPLYASDLWMPCWSCLHPIWLLIYRLFVFLSMSWLLYDNTAKDGGEDFYFYTQWTFTLVIMYFALGTIISALGCWEYSRTPVNVHEENNCLLKRDLEDGKSAISLASVTNKSVDPITSQRCLEQEEIRKKAGIWGHLMQILYQTCAGAVMLTDIVFWGILLPFEAHGHLTLLDGCMHGLNLLFLLTDTALNRLQISWLGMTYFVFWSSTYIIFQWILHACCISWWPYMFLELSTPWAPLWYLALALVHILCYGLYSWTGKWKIIIFSKLFPRSFVISN